MTFVLLFPSIRICPPLLSLPPSLFHVILPTSMFNMFPEQCSYYATVTSKFLHVVLAIYFGLFFNGFLTRPYEAKFDHSPVTPAMLYERKQKSTLDNMQM